MPDRVDYDVDTVSRDLPADPDADRDGDVRGLLRHRASPPGGRRVLRRDAARRRAGRDVGRPAPGKGRIPSMTRNPRGEHMVTLAPAPVARRWLALLVLAVGLLGAGAATAYAGD